MTIDCSLRETPIQKLTAGPARKNPDLKRASFEEKHARIEQMTDQALADLGEALAAGRSDKLQSYLTTMGRFHQYSWGNVLLILTQRPDATHVAGFNKWKELGRFVRKGEHGIVILAPVMRRVGDIVEQKEDGTEESKPLRQMVNVKPVYVFDVSQTDGKELPEFSKVAGDPAENVSSIKRFIAGKNIEVEYVGNLGGALGISSGGKIRCLNGLSPAEEFHTLAHELAHELLHRGERRQETTKRVRELEAESVAFVVCSAIGLEAKAASTDYIHLFQGSKDRLAESLHFIRAVASEILVGIEPQDAFTGKIPLAN